MFHSKKILAELAKCRERNRKWTLFSSWNISRGVIHVIGYGSKRWLSDVTRWLNKEHFRNIEASNRIWRSTSNACTVCGDMTDPWLSPISIEKGAAKPMENCLPLLYHNYWHSEGFALLLNNGKTVEIRMKRRRYQPVLCGGPLPEPYRLDQLHFHWGPSNHQGSEHLVNGKRYAMEVQLIHCAEKYKSLDKACDYRKGIAVVAILLQASADVPLFEFEHVVSKLPLIKSPYMTASLNAEKAISWLRCRALNSGYYTYGGTLTYPLGGRDVIWIVYPDPIPVTPSQVAAFRNVLSPERTPITDNCMKLRNGKVEVKFCLPRGNVSTLPR
ncbi:hypothetical protein L9F63_021661 [Diploptera punctata]|uniref:carbonic anhydrase n=1 Tax=Diploptera punctata TaxID=6984 RepID=A0AAD8EBI8_DIPPU|nr:hypothetical protein L9F63_021661 [Diploptera punctata]